MTMQVGGKYSSEMTWTSWFELTTPLKLKLCMPSSSAIIAHLVSGSYRMTCDDCVALIHRIRVKKEKSPLIYIVWLGCDWIKSGSFDARFFVLFSLIQLLSMNGEMFQNISYFVFSLEFSVETIWGASIELKHFMVLFTQLKESWCLWPFKRVYWTTARNFWVGTES